MKNSKIIGPRYNIQRKGKIMCFLNHAIKMYREEENKKELKETKQETKEKEEVKKNEK